MDQLFHELAKVLAERKKKRKSAFYVVFNERVDRIADILEKMKCKRKKRKKKKEEEEEKKRLYYHMANSSYHADSY